jgi:Na+-translocating ferredoxin:NAD+ oxidoreductase subunit B
MVDKGLIIRKTGKNQIAYAGIPMAPGIMELNMHSFYNEEIGERWNRYAEAAWSKKTLEKGILPPRRTVPVETAINSTKEVLSYEQLGKILEGLPRPIVVTDCYCRKIKHDMGEGCGKPIENCLACGPFAEHYIRKGIGRQINDEELRKIFREANEAGLIPNFENVKDNSDQLWICNCCGCCCGLFSAINKMYPKGEIRSYIRPSNFITVIEEETCSGCETCLDRCQVLAIYMEDGIARLREERCIGCGLCVSTCPDGAIQLVERKGEQLPYLPDDTLDFVEKKAQKTASAGDH